jgi:23S rRNA pseudouridine1911/1915/1917 synthase
MSAGGGTLRVVVPADAAGERLDRFLAAHLAGTTRAALARWIHDGRVWVDGRPASKPGLGLRPGMEIRVDRPRPSPGRPEPQAIAFGIVHEDDEMLVVDKPACLTVHPGHGCPAGTLVNGLLGRGVRLSSVGAPDRPGIVHRLDRGTSGLLVVAKTDAAHHALARAFAARAVRKRYVALVWGHPRPAAGAIEREIGRSRRDPTRMAVRSTRGRRRGAITVYSTIESLRGFALLEVEPATGRTHQIRVHLESIHHPIVGDDRYGGRGWRGVQDPLRRGALRGFDRLALHAAGLALPHPATGRIVRFTSPLPADFERLLRALREAG